MLQSLSISICFVALIHVELELHAHRDTIRVLTSQHTGENPVLRNTVNDEVSYSTLMETHSDLAEGMYHWFKHDVTKIQTTNYRSN